ncbi:MAG TPA: MBL fold metallo-hydrolase [Thermoanaerobaculia bacterium]|jgi:pyrroloquinoline quinone biosynthesis protein B
MILAALLAHVIVLGIAQDGGYPQAGCERPDCVAAWNNPKLRRHVASLAIVDPSTNEQWMIDATPDFPEQLHSIGGRINGILLTHAHIGHYLGLAQLGREVIGAHDMPVYAMPRMRAFLEHNGPWDQLVRLHNIDLRPLEDGVPVQLNANITVTPVVVPHRGEYSETVAFLVKGPKRSILWMPDTDRFEHIDQLIARVDVAYLDGTFFDAKELPRRNLAEIPHPLMRDSMERFAKLPPNDRAKIRFIHLNQSNPALRDPKIVRPFAVAAEEEREGL